MRTTNALSFGIELFSLIILIVGRRTPVLVHQKHQKGGSALVLAIS